MHKMRVAADQGEVTEVTGRVRDKRAIVGDDVRTEIEARLANFRAHQERFHREREAYFSATLARARAAYAAGSGSRDRASPNSER